MKISTHCVGSAIPVVALFQTAPGVNNVLLLLGREMQSYLCCWWWTSVWNVIPVALVQADCQGEKGEHIDPNKEFLEGLP